MKPGTRLAGRTETSRPEPAPPISSAAQTAFSSESGRTYRLDKLVGKGGFGEVYLATPTPQDGLPAQVCIKITERLSGWLREAYFAELLYREPRALKVYDRFAEVENGRARYCIALEYAVNGDLGAWLTRKGAQPERFVRRELAAILSALDILHQGQAMHRDLTPFNVFVCEDEELKLGDFGIAVHQRSQRGVTADAFNVFNAPAEIAWGRVRRWQQRDDVYQIGLLAAMLLRGDIASPMSSRDVRRLPCSDHLKEVIYRCLGARGKRYQAAGELIKALRHRPKQPHLGRIGSLEGKRVSFTGFLTRPRSEAIAAARKAGATVQSKPGPSSDVLVRGRPNALQIAGEDGGTKLLEIRRQANLGHTVTVIGERHFWKLVESAKPRPRGKRTVKRAARA